MKKKILLGMLVGVILFGLTACGSGNTGVAGTWEVSKMVTREQELSPDEARQYGLVETRIESLVLEENGTATIHFADESYEGTWKATDLMVTIEIDEVAQDFTLVEGGKSMFVNMGGGIEMHFEKK